MGDNTSTTRNEYIQRKLVVLGGSKDGLKDKVYTIKQKIDNYLIS